MVLLLTLVRRRQNLNFDVTKQRGKLIIILLTLLHTYL